MTIKKALISAVAAVLFFPVSRISRAQSGDAALLDISGFWNYLVDLGGPVDVPSGWHRTDFDDSGWSRDLGPIYGGYGDPPGRNPRGFPLRPKVLYVRGKFNLTEPARAGKAALSLSYRGGVVAYLNGNEIARGHMPAGAVNPDTPCEEYPVALLLSGKQRKGHEKKNEERIRRLESVTIDSSLLRRGGNVLALEIHAPGIPEDAWKKITDHRRPTPGWITCGLCGLQLRVSGAVGAMPNTARPASLQVWGADTMQLVTDMDWGDPCRPASVDLIGIRGGRFSGQIVIGCDKPIKGLKVTASPLTGPGGGMGAECVTARFAEWGMGKPSFIERPGVDGGERMCFDALLDNPPPEVPVRTHSPKPAKRGPKPPPPISYPWGAVQPVWITVVIPPNAAAGNYTGTIHVEAAGYSRQDVPLELRVIDWSLPQNEKRRAFMEFYQSPETLALRYNTPLWSEKHWTLIGKTFRLIGAAGNKILHIPIICKTGFGNAQSMIRWKPKGDGSYDFDLSVMDRYIDLAMKCQGRPWAIDFLVYDIAHPGNPRGIGGGFGLYTEKAQEYGLKSDHHTFVHDYDDPETVKRLIVGPIVTALHADGTTSELQGPLYSDADGLVRFWSPLVTVLRDHMRKRGLEDVVQLGHCCDLTFPPQMGEAWKKLWPGRPWATHAHSPLGVWNAAQKWVPGHHGGLCSAVYDFHRTVTRDMIGKHRIKTSDLFGWMLPHDTLINAKYDRELLRSPGVQAEALLPQQRMSLERAVASGAHGRSCMGGDFFGAAKDGRGRYQGIFGRYHQTNWSYTGYDGSYLSAGPDGAVSTIPFEVIVEGMQECEAKIFIEMILMDDAKRAKLSSDLADRCWRVLDRRRDVHMFLFSLVREWGHYAQDAYVGFDWKKSSQELYTAAADLAKISGE